MIGFGPVSLVPKRFLGNSQVFLTHNPIDLHAGCSDVFCLCCPGELHLTSLQQLERFRWAFVRKTEALRLELSKEVRSDQSVLVWFVFGFTEIRDLN